MSRDPQILRAISWRDLCPWLLLLRVFSLAISPSLLLLGTVAVATIPLGWRVGGEMFLSDTDRNTTAVRRLQKQWEAFPGSSTDKLEPPEIALRGPKGPLNRVWESTDAMTMATMAFVKFLVDFQPRQLAYITFGALWTLLIAALLGGAISRMAVVYLGREESAGLKSSLQHAWRNLPAYFLAPLYPLIVVGFVVAGCAVMGGLMKVGVLAAFASLFWIFALLASGAAAILLMGLAVGWPLMWGAVSAEQDSEAFEALSRSYSYVWGRPLNLLFYAVVSSLIGALGYLVVGWFCHLTINIAHTSAVVGSGGALLGMLEGTESVSSLQRGAGILIGALNQLLAAAQTGYQFSFFWAAAAGIYLLIRSDVDHTELDEVFLEDQGERFTLPALQLDASGAVQVKPADESVAEPSPESSAAAEASEDGASPDEPEADSGDEDTGPPKKTS